MKPSIRRLALTLPLFALTATTAHTQEFFDDVVDCPDGNAPVPLCYGQHADCTIDFLGDLDQFRFYAKEGDVVRVRLTSLSNNLDPQFEVRDPLNATVLGPAGCATGCCQCTGGGELVVATTGFHRILVKDDFNDNTGSYTLHIERFLPEYPTPSLGYGAPPVSFYLGHKGDHDWFTFEGVAGSEVLLAFNSLTNNLDPQAYVYDPTGALVTNHGCATGCCMCTFTINIMSLPMDGTYSVVLFDDDYSNFGSVTASIQCLFGNCPPPLVDAPLGASFCMSTPNSTMNPATIQGFGTASVTENRIYLQASDVPAGESGIFFAGMSGNAGIPLGPGFLCLDPLISRFPVTMSCGSGSSLMLIDNADLPFNMTALPGQTWHYQYWFRDPAAGGAAFNLTDAVSITLTP